MKTKQVLSKTMLLICVLCTVRAVAAEQDIMQDVSDALRTGDAVKLAQYINPTVELVIMGDENIYSRAQAELLLRDFFTRNKPSEFRVNHQGTKRTTSFAIGMLITNKGNLRVSLFMKVDNGQMLIHKLRIEKGDNPTR